MRILHVLKHTNRLNGNVHAAVDLACAQAKAGHSAAIASSGGDFDDLLSANGVETMIVRQRSGTVTLINGLMQLHRLIKDWRPNVVHAHMMTSAMLAWPICKAHHIPLVTTVHNEFQKSAILMGLGTRVIAVSAAVARSMQRRGIPKRRLNVVLNGTIGSVRGERKERVPRHLESPAILFVGGQHPRKGVPDLLNAFDIVHRKHPQARLYIVGDGPCLDAYIDLAKSLKCADAVTFFGAQDDPFPFLRAADIFVLTSHADPAPLVLPEAREAGCAVVATDVDGVPELLEFGKAGILVPARAPGRLAEVLCSLIDDPAKLREWREKSQFNLERMHLARVVEETLDVYAAAHRDVRRNAASPSRLVPSRGNSSISKPGQQ